MGIKKDVFYRHIVRVRVAFEKEWKTLFYNEIQPAWKASNGNVDRALQIVISEPQKFPMLNQFSFGKNSLEDVMVYASQISRKDVPVNYTDILEETRKGRPSLPRSAQDTSPRVIQVISPDKFFQVLRVKSSDIYNVLNQNDKNDISRIIDFYGESFEEKLNNIYEVLKKAWIRSFFENYDKIESKVLNLGHRVAGDFSQVYRVIFAYLDSLE